MLTAAVPPYSEVIKEHVLKVRIGNETFQYVFLQGELFTLH